METTTNKDVGVCVDRETSTVSLTDLLSGTMVYLYDSRGSLQAKQAFVLPLLKLTLLEHGMYVIVMSHSNCKVEVRRFVYEG